MVTLTFGLAAINAPASFSARGWTVVEPDSVIEPVSWEADVVVEIEVALPLHPEKMSVRTRIPVEIKATHFVLLLKLMLLTKSP